MLPTTMTIFDFSPTSDLSNWMVVDDVVMGGRSDGNLEINEEGHGVFYGKVSLENYGGFSSVRYRPGTKDVSSYSKAVLRLKGDGKRYQFRVKSNLEDRHSYITYFETSGEWETIEIPLNDLSPWFRGQQLRRPNYSGQQLEEVAFLIANKVAEGFRLEIDHISLE